jgi:PKD repeat protein
MKQFTVARGAVLALLALAAGCTMKTKEAPEFSGPSEFGTAISISITPDIIQQDGASQSVVTITARGPNGAPLANVPVRAEIRVNGTPVDFGSLSARNLVTDATGRATLVYTAPPAVPGLSTDDFTVVDIGVTPLGSNFGNSATRFASLRLVPRGTVVPPAGLRAVFTATPVSPIENQSVLFDASLSTSNVGIARYNWNFGDGSTQTTESATISHAFRSTDTFTVTLTIEDAFGRTANTAQSITVNPGVGPTAAFTFSPTNPQLNTLINFNGSASLPAPGRRIVGYHWDFGDGTGADGLQVSHAYNQRFTFTVTLTVTDDVGKTATTSQTITIP